jgi:catechol 2,3-dioxygenase
MGPVEVAVTNGDRALRFYRDVLGLTPMPSVGGEIRLGAGDTELVVLHPGAAEAVQHHTTGLYHLAIVVPTRRELARVIDRLLSLRYPNSPTDHVITKADYLWDPDGNGIEVYAETPEDGTMTYHPDRIEVYDRAGRPRSGRDPIDLDALFGELEAGDQLDEPMPEGTKIGHVHLHVADLDEAVHFYHELVGFDIVGVVPSFQAAFVSAGGYHHHLGLNTWAGEGVPPAPGGAAGLRHFSIVLPTPGDLDQVLERLDRGGVTASPVQHGFFVNDPSSNRIKLSTATPVP